MMEMYKNIVVFVSIAAVVIGDNITLERVSFADGAMHSINLKEQREKDVAVNKPNSMAEAAVASRINANRRAHPASNENENQLLNGNLKKQKVKAETMKSNQSPESIPVRRENRPKTGRNIQVKKRGGEKCTTPDCHGKQRPVKGAKYKPNKRQKNSDKKGHDDARKVTVNTILREDPAIVAKSTGAKQHSRTGKDKNTGQRDAVPEPTVSSTEIDQSGKVETISLEDNEEVLNSVEDGPQPLENNSKRDAPGSSYNEDGKYVGAFNQECAEAYLLTPGLKKGVSLKLSEKLLIDGGTTCHWDIIGDSKCYPEIRCEKFSLANSNQKSGEEGENLCNDEYLEVTDGFMGSERFCGSDFPEVVTSSDTLRDLYITLKLAGPGKDKKFSCVVTCGDGDNAKATPLKNVLQHKTSDKCSCGESDLPRIEQEIKVVSKKDDKRKVNKPLNQVANKSYKQTKVQKRRKGAKRADTKTKSTPQRYAKIKGNLKRNANGEEDSKSESIEKTDSTASAEEIDPTNTDDKGGQTNEEREEEKVGEEKVESHEGADSTTKVQEENEENVSQTQRKRNKPNPKGKPEKKEGESNERNDKTKEKRKIVKNLKSGKDKSSKVRDGDLTETSFENSKSSTAKRNNKESVKLIKTNINTKGASSKLDENGSPEEKPKVKVSRSEENGTPPDKKNETADVFPWMVSLVAKDTRKPFCSGTIVNSIFVLTSAQCMIGQYGSVQNFHVLLRPHKLDMEQGGAGVEGVNQLREEDLEDGSIRYSAVKYFVHPLFDERTNDFDVALLKLEKSLDFAKELRVAPVCLPDVDVERESFEENNAIIAGWGLSSVNARTKIFEQAQLSVVSSDKCGPSYKNASFTNRMICSNDADNLDHCKGDPGGPLIAEKSVNEWDQIGIVSFVDGCSDQRLPVKFTNTRQVTQWISYIGNLEDALWCGND